MLIALIILGVLVVLFAGLFSFYIIKVGRERQAFDLIREEDREDWEGEKEHALVSQKGELTGFLFERLGVFASSFPYNIYEVYPIYQAPIDFAVFVGLEESKGAHVDSIVLFDCKTGKDKRLSLRQKSIKECIDKGRVEFKKLTIDNNGKWYIVKSPKPQIAMM